MRPPATTLVLRAKLRHFSRHRDRRHAVAIARCPGIHLPGVFRVHVQRAGPQQAQRVLGGRETLHVSPLTHPCPARLTAQLPCASPAALKLSHLRPFLPFIVRTFPLAVRKKMVEWYPREAMKDFVYILTTMHETSKRIFERKKRALEGGSNQAHNEKAEGDLGPLMQGKDIMSILCEFKMQPANIGILYLLSRQ